MSHIIARILIYNQIIKQTFWGVKHSSIKTILFNLCEIKYGANPNKILIMQICHKQVSEMPLYVFDKYIL